MTMERKEAKELLPIIQAFAEGKQIQYLDDRGFWEDVIGNVAFSDTPSRYRIKSELKYRPFNTAEKCWNQARKHSDFPWIKHVDGEYTQIKNIGKYEVKVEYSDRIREEYLFDEAFNVFTFTDGTPFGINEE